MPGHAARRCLQPRTELLPAGHTVAQVSLSRAFRRGGRHCHAAAVAVALVVALAAGCADPVRQPGATPWTPPSSPDPAGGRWAGKITADEAGALAAPGFNTLIDTAAPEWAKSADTTAAELAGLNEPFDGPVEIYLHQDGENDAPTMTATLTRLGDDSVMAIRYSVRLTRGDDGRYRFGSGTRTFRCQSGRGHQSFGTDLCS
jgi:hypothetical protein